LEWEAIVHVTIVHVIIDIVDVMIHIAHVIIECVTHVGMGGGLAKIQPSNMSKIEALQQAGCVFTSSNSLLHCVAMACVAVCCRALQRHVSSDLYFLHLCGVFWCLRVL